MITVPPQAIRRNDGSYVVLNVDLDSLDEMQRTAIGMQVWEQIMELMKVNGEYAPATGFHKTNGIGHTRDIDRVVAEAVGVAYTSIHRVRPRLLQRPDVVEKMLAGEIRYFNDVSRAVGMQIHAKLADGGYKSQAGPNSSVFGRGDRFYDALTPLERYLKGWEKRDFLYTHVNPKEAKRRLKKLEELQRMIEATTSDLTKRSHASTLNVRRS